MVTMDQIEFREGEITDLLAFLNVANPKGYSRDEIKRAALSAINEHESGTFVGTAGWYATVIAKGYSDSTGKPYLCLVSVMAYSARRYAESVLGRSLVSD